jgi:hypothetical protein
MSPNIPMQRPPAASSFHATVTRQFPSLQQRNGGPIEVKVNGDVIKEGEQSAEVLALLGIVPDELDNAFHRYVGNGHWPYIEYSPGNPFPDEFAQRNQSGAMWQVEATVDAGQGVQEVKDLAYCDFREVHRYLTLQMRQWNHITYATLADNGFDDSKGRTSTLISESKTIEPGGAVGSWYSGIKDDEITATRNAARALEAARRDLDRAMDEMEIAIKVADAAWQGDRADAAKYKFCTEASIVEAIRDVTHGWEDFTQDVARQQGLAKDHDDKFKREVATEVGITILVGIITFGAGALVKGSLFAAKLAKWARDVEILRKAMQSRYGEVFVNVSRSAAVAKTMRITARAMGDMSTRLAVNKASGQETTGQDWLFAFVFAGGIGQGTSDAAKWGLKQMESRWGITFASPLAKGGAKGGIQGVPRAGANVAFTDQALGRVMAGYGTGIPGEALKEQTKTKLKKDLFEAMKNDPALRRDAEATVKEQLRQSQTYLGLDSSAQMKKLVDKEIERRVERAVDPILDYTFTAGGRAAADGTHRVSQGSDIPPADLRSGSNGLVSQPADHPTMAVPAAK